MKFIFSILILVTSLKSYSQEKSNKLTIRDFFIPDNSANKVEYYANYKTPPYIRCNREMFFLPTEKGYDVYDSQLFAEEVTSKSIRSVTITNTEVRMQKIKLESMINKPKLKTFEIPIVILKLPKGNKPTIWTTRSDVGDVESCISSFASVKYKGEDLDAIKVIKTSKENRIKTVEYYAKGIGLFKVEFYDPIRKETQDVNEAYRVSKVYIP